MPLIGYTLLILLYMVFRPSALFSTRAAVKEICRYAIYGLVAAAIANVRVDRRTFAAIWDSAFWIALAVATAQFLGCVRVTEWLRRFYGDSVHFSLVTQATLRDFRTGSVFVNPNAYAEFILAYLVVVACLYAGGSKKGIRFLASAFGVVWALVLAGSRTGFVAAVVILACFLCCWTLRHRTRFRREYLLAFVPIALIGGSIVGVLACGGFDIAGLRMLDVSSGLDNSIAYKFGAFSLTIRELSDVNLVIGAGPYEDRTWGSTMIDFDLGFILAYYGLIGAILYLATLLCLYGDCKLHRAGCQDAGTLLVGAMLLFGLTTGVFLHLRIFSVFLVLLNTKLPYARMSHSASAPGGATPLC